MRPKLGPCRLERLVVIPNAGHNDAWDRGGPSLIEQIAAFARGG